MRRYAGLERETPGRLIQGSHAPSHYRLVSVPYQWKARSGDEGYAVPIAKTCRCHAETDEGNVTLLSLPRFRHCWQTPPASIA
jgi:hypothetical protein